MKKRALKKTFKSCLNILLAAVLAVGSFSAAFVSKNVGADTVAEAANSYTLDQLYSEISEFENMMDGTTIYTNMSAAYTAYKTACEVYYENLYGYDYETGATTVAYSQDTVNSAYTALSNAINNMSAFTGYVGTATTAADGSYSSSSLYSGTYPSSVLGGGSTSSGDKMSGLLYTYGVGSTSGWFGASWNKVSNSNTRLGNNYNYNNNHGLRYGTVVFLWTGTGHSSGGNTYNETSTYAVPINAYFSPGDKKAAQFLSVNSDDQTGYTGVLNNSNFILNTAWHGIKSSTGSASVWDNTAGYNSTLSTYTGTNSFQYLNQSYTALNSNDSSSYWSAYNATNYDYVVHTYSNTLYYKGNPNKTNSSDSTNLSATAYYAKYDMICYYTKSGSSYNGYQPYFVFYPNRDTEYVYYTNTAAGPVMPTTSNDYYSMYTGGGDSYQTGDAASYIYVLNYDLVLTALENNKSALAMNGGSDGVTYYRQDKNGAMTALLAAFDAITDYDPNSAFSANTTSLGVSSLVATAAGTLSGYVNTLNSAAATAADNYDTITYTIKQVYQTGSDPLDFTDASGNMVTTANDTDFDSYTNLSYDKSGTVKGTVGVYFEDSVYSEEKNGFIGNRLNSPDTVEATSTSAITTLAGYSFSPNATAEYYKQVASHTLTTGQYSSINEYSKATVTNTWTDRPSNGIQRAEIHVVPYAQNVTFYSFYTANLIEIKVNYVDADDQNTVLKTENITIPYTTLTDTVDSGFVHETTSGYSKYVLLADGGENNNGDAISDAVSSTYTNFTEDSDTEQTYTWLSSIAQQTTTYNSSSGKETYTSITAEENAVQRTVSTDYVTTVYYRPLQVTVNYSVVSGTEIEDTSYGTLTLTGQANTDATATETVTDTGNLTGATVTVNQSQGNATYSLDGWYYSTSEITDASAFSTMSAYSTDEAVALALTETDVEDWTENQTIYLYALLSMASTYTTLTVPIHVQDGQEGDVVVVEIADSNWQGYGTAVTLDSDGNATAVFTVYDGDYYVWVDTNWGYDILTAITDGDNASILDPYEIAVSNATTMDTIEISKTTSPTGNAAEDIATNDFYGYISG
ncbi:MAG: hypothetical protein LUH82_04675 [Clostridiales bacterium]|nr:hypothetical protein [Clostridiales bacterium]